MAMNLKVTRFALIYRTNRGKVRVTETKHWKRGKKVEVLFSNVSFGPRFKIALTELWIETMVGGAWQTACIPLDPVAKDEVIGGSMGSVRYFDLGAIESAFDSIDA